MFQGFRFAAEIVFSTTLIVVLSTSISRSVLIAVITAQVALGVLRGIYGKCLSIRIALAYFARTELFLTKEETAYYSNRIKTSLVRSVISLSLVALESGVLAYLVNGLQWLTVVYTVLYLWLLMSASGLGPFMNSSPSWYEYKKNTKVYINDGYIAKLTSSQDILNNWYGSPEYKIVLRRDNDRLYFEDNLPDDSSMRYKAYQDYRDKNSEAFDWLCANNKQFNAIVNAEYERYNR